MQLNKWSSENDDPNEIKIRVEISSQERRKLLQKVSRKERVREEFIWVNGTNCGSREKENWKEIGRVLVHLMS